MPSYGRNGESLRRRSIGGCRDTSDLSLSFFLLRFISLSLSCFSTAFAPQLIHCDFGAWAMGASGRAFAFSVILAFSLPYLWVFGHLSSVRLVVAEILRLF
jgi:hypothetical protein